MKAPPAPIWIGDVELGRSLVPAGVSRPLDRDDSAARLLVRLHRQLLGFVSLPVTGTDLAPDAVGVAVQAQLGGPLRRHLEADGLAVPAALPCDGLGGSERCAHLRRPPVAEPITVVVCTRDRPAILATCLALLQELRYPAFEVVVVDNAPTTTETRDCFARLVGDDGRFRYVQEPVPGLSRARNRGLAEARFSRVAFTDDDVQVDPWWLDGIAAGFARDHRAGCVTGLVPPAQLEHPAQHYFDRRFSWASRLEPRVHDMTSGRDSSVLYPYSAGLFGTGANFAVDRDLLDRLGGFDEALGAGSPAGGGEDLDAFVRVLQADRSLVYEPSAIVWHVHRDGDGAQRRQLFYYGVGLTAFLSKYVADRRTTWDILTRVPEGLRRMRRLWSPAEIAGRAPPTLVAAEVIGMAAGPLAYRRGRRRLKRARAQARA